MPEASVIKVCRTEDFDDEIAALDRQCFTKREAFAVNINTDMGAVRWIALDGDVPIGYAVAYPQPSRKDPGTYLDRYGVLPEYAGKGLGKRLLRAWLKAARKDGAKCAWTYTVASNAASINALVSCHFRAWRPAWGEDCYCIWRRALD